MKNILKETKNLHYAPAPNRGIWYQCEELPEESLITSCFAIVKYKDNIVLVKHKTRGLEIAGGHKEDESSVECLKREIKEELGISQIIDISALCHQEITLLGPRPKEYQYPYPKSYQVIFMAEAKNLDEFIECFDSIGRELIPLNKIKNNPQLKKQEFIFNLYLEKIKQ